MFLIVRPSCFLLENLILALAASKTDIFLMGCGKLQLHVFYTEIASRGAFQRAAEQEQSGARRKGQRAAASPGPHVGPEVLRLWGAAPGGR